MTNSRKEELIKQFDPSSPGMAGSLFGLPFDEETAEIIVIPVPWEVTVSYSGGTVNGPSAVRNASLQVDLYLRDIAEAWKLGVFMPEENDRWRRMSDSLRPKAEKYIGMLEEGIEEHPELDLIKSEIDQASAILKQELKDEVLRYMKAGKQVVLLGGDHSTPLGYMEALAEVRGDFGILQIDAHADLRKAYEGFTYSHASIMYNALGIGHVSKLVQVGIRDYCEEEALYMKAHADRVVVFFDEQLKEAEFEGIAFAEKCKQIVAYLPKQVYVSFDIDGLDPQLCPNTGTPVPGGLNYAQAIFLIKEVVRSGRTIIGFDLNEVAPGNNEWDGNVGARLLYNIINLMGVSQQKLNWAASE